MDGKISEEMAGLNRERGVWARELRPWECAQTGRRMGGGYVITYAQAAESYVCRVREGDGRLAHYRAWRSVLESLKRAMARRMH